LLNKLADLLEIEGENEFRVRAYRNAARAVDGFPRSVADLVHEHKDLSELPGIGKSMAQKIEEFVKTGRLRQLDELERKFPGQLAEMMSLPSLGPKRVKALYEQLHIDTLDQLERAARDHEISRLPGLGEKTERKILDELQRKKGVDERIRLIRAEEIAEPLVDYLKQIDGVKEVVVAGSYRRRRETVGDLDILATCKKSSPVMDRFVEYPEVETVISHGSTRSSVRLRSGLNVDLRVVAEVSYGAALHYFTGSKSHNIAVRQMGVKKGLKINEYGVFKGSRRVAGRTEEEVHILAHPTGRMIGKREPYDVDLERIMESARQRGCVLELSAQPERLDLSDVHARLAKEMGVKLAISTDAHRTADFRYLRYGVDQARRGWVEADDVVNTRSWEDLKRLLNTRR
jgi:DNA polymerase (family 10)